MKTLLDPYLEEQAALFIAGELCQKKQREFGLLMEADVFLQQHVAALADTAAPLMLGQFASAPASLKSKIMAATDSLAQSRRGCVVQSTPDGYVTWVSTSFSELCGYSLDELRGEKLGPLLQGKETDFETARRLGSAARQARPFHDVILNYRKNGTPYWVEIELFPIVAEDGRKICLIAEEFERPDRMMQN